ncbi:MAG TPA: IS200/IS605 family accessory protein TnpB-related protein, partial [Ktedonobacteraceae bacterium]
YNKQRANDQRHLSHENRFTSRHLDRVTTKRNRCVESYLHMASRRIIDLLVAEGIGTLVIGKNPLWKQEVNMGKRNNQQFVQLPHARFMDQLTYKARLPLDGWPSERMTDRHICHHFKILYCLFFLRSTMSGTRSSDEVGKSYTHPVGFYVI